MLKRLPKSTKRLSIVFSGYLDHHEPPRGAYAVVTNYQDFTIKRDSSEACDEFRVDFWSERPPFNGEYSAVQRFGMWNALTLSDINTLRQFLSEHKPAAAIIGKGIEVMREVADRPQARGLIGKQLSVIVAPRDPAIRPTVSYHSDVVRNEIAYPDQMVLLNDNLRLTGMGLRMRKINPDGNNVLVVPKVGRNAPYPCNSGEKYKRCHGR